MLRPRLNNQITAPELRVLAENGENLGVMKTSEALRLSLDKGLDLIEITANANPPIARIMSYDKYRYQRGKEEKKERLSQKTAEQKKIQISARAKTNDLIIKARQLEKFLGEGHPIEICLRLRGREKYNKDWARLKLNEFLKMITIEHKITSEPKFGGYGLNLQISKK